MTLKTKHSRRILPVLTAFIFLGTTVQVGAKGVGIPDETGSQKQSSETESTVAATEKPETKPDTVRPPLVNLIISKDVGGRQADLDRLAAAIRQQAFRDQSPVLQPGGISHS